jgi:hypothetical protein
MIRTAKTVFLLFLGFSLQAQSGTISPYSYAGLGEVNFRGTHENRFMGGLEVYNDSIHANLSNPSSYAKLKLTTYSLGLNYKTNKLSDFNDAYRIAAASLDYIGIAIPTRLFGFGFGIVPQTSVGYKLNRLTEVENQPTTIDIYEGEGGINKVFFSVGFNAFKYFSFGATFNYDFGQIQYDTGRFIDEVTLGTVVQNESSISGIDFKFSSNFEIPLSAALRLHAMYSFAPGSSLTATNSRFILTRTYAGSSDFGDIVEVDLKDSGLDKSKIKTPDVSSFGIGVGKELKWFVGAQYTLNSMSQFSHRFISLPNVSYQDGSQFSFGGFYIPEYNSINDYWKRIVFRMGFRHESTGIVVNKFGLNETGINFGVGLPLAGFSNANIGLEYGLRDTGNAVLLKEKYWALRIGFSLNDRWFLKRKFN